MSQEVDSLRAQVTMLKSEVGQMESNLDAKISSVKADQIAAGRLNGEDLTLPVSEYKPIHKVKAYQAYSWFNDKQVAQMNAGLEATKKNQTVDWDRSYRPLEHQYNNLDVVSHPELMDNVEWQVQTFRGDVTAYEQADVGIMIYDPAQPDDGVAWEAASLRTLGKPVVLVIPDDNETPLNLMIAHGVTDIITVNELATYDFNNINLGTYHGKIF